MVAGEMTTFGVEAVTTEFLHGNNYVSGGEGSDTIMATGAINFPHSEEEGDNYNIIYGYGGRDKIIIVRDAGANINGGSDNDEIDARADAGFGGFKVYAGDGDDKVLAVENAAVIYGGCGADTLEATGEVYHRVYGQLGNDRIRINTDNGSLGDRGAGNDYLLSVFEATLKGGSGDDILESRGQIAANTMYGGPGADEFRCHGGYNNDDLYSGSPLGDSVQDYNKEKGDTT
jgi:RTX calcium-binding nonapeptide repeat (4 copies)